MNIATAWWRARFLEHAARVAIVHDGRELSYGGLLAEVDRALAELESLRGQVVLLGSGYHPVAAATLLALLELDCVTALAAPGLLAQSDDLQALAHVQALVSVDASGERTLERCSGDGEHPHFATLRASRRPGLVIFSSGSSGRMKGVVHDAERLLSKYATPRRARTVLPFMLFDHIGGLNTLLRVLSSGGTAVLTEDRSPRNICRLIEAHRVQALPASPTFLNLLLLGEELEAFDLSSLEVIGYGAERMPEATLGRLQDRFPTVRLVQNYGLSEVGIVDTRSEASASVWMKPSEAQSFRVRDGLLEIKSDTAMLGYLDAPSPFTEDGWLRTGDRVEVSGPYVRVLGRESDLIIVGGEKVYPAEVEELVGAMPGVLEVVVQGEPHAITGQVVKATVRLESPDESRSEFRRRMNAFLSERVPRFKVPQKVVVTQEELHSSRQKKLRSTSVEK